MLRAKYKSSDEVIDSIINRPIEAFFSIRIDGQLLERMNENADDIVDSIREIRDEIVSLTIFIMICFLHIGELIFFPAVRIVRFAMLRRDIIRREKHYRSALRNEYYSDKSTD